MAITISTCGKKISTAHIKILKHQQNEETIQFFFFLPSSPLKFSKQPSTAVDVGHCTIISCHQILHRFQLRRFPPLTPSLRRFRVLTSSLNFVYVVFQSESLFSQIFTLSSFVTAHHFVYVSSFHLLIYLFLRIRHFFF